MTIPKDAPTTPGEFMRAAAQRERAGHPRAERLEDVKAFREYQRLQDVDPFAAAAYRREHGAAIGAASEIVDAVSQANGRDVPVDAVIELMERAGGGTREQ